MSVTPISPAVAKRQPKTRRRIAGERPRALRLPDRKLSSIVGWIEDVSALSDELERVVNMGGAQIHRAIIKSGRLPGGVDKMRTAREWRRTVLKAVNHLQAFGTMMETSRFVILTRIGDPSKKKRDGGIDVDN